MGFHAATTILPCKGGFSLARIKFTLSLIFKTQRSLFTCILSPMKEYFGTMRRHCIPASFTSDTKIQELWGVLYWLLSPLAYPR